MICQVCHIVLAVEEADQESVTLELGEARISTSEELTEYFLGEVRIATSKELTEYFITNEPESPTLIRGKEGEVLLKIVFKRRIIQAELQDIKLVI